jgi:acyl-CoA thioester hydrolase
MTTPFRAVAHPWQCDVLGHLTTRYYVGMFDDASYHFLHDLFGWGGVIDPERRRGWVDVSHKIGYLDEVVAGDPLEIRAALKKIGNKSLVVDYEMINRKSGEVAATLEAVYVLFDLEQRSGVAIDDGLRRRAEAFLVADAGA